MNEEETARIRAMEEVRTFAINTLPPLWRGLYERCIEEGFRDLESLILIQTYILSQCPYGVRGLS